MASPIPDASNSKLSTGLFRPRTLLGTISLCSAVAFVIVLSATRILVPTGVLGQGGATVFSNLAISIPMFASALLAAVAFVLGVASFFKGERSILVGLGAVVGFGATALAVALVAGD